MERTVEEIKMRCDPILNDKQVVFLVKKSSSPTSAYDMVLNKMGDISKAQAGRWLAILRRDHNWQYQKLIK
ncbi:MAG: hypothetical protein KAV41_02600 [Candidatus Pacebacteria bacterium]|nr:hypothetical protein [Candidatus Paceibacterota bacterium]